MFSFAKRPKIRRKIIEDNILESVIGLPANLFFGTGIPAAILIFNKDKTTKDVLFIDASREHEDVKKQNRLTDENIDKIVRVYKNFETVEKYSYRSTYAEIEENEFNLNIPRYVDTYEEEEDVDIPAVQKEIERRKKELAETREEMQNYLVELGL